MLAKSYDEALTVCKAWVERAPSRESLLYLARIYETLKQYDKAEAQMVQYNSLPAMWVLERQRRVLL